MKIYKPNFKKPGNSDSAPKKYLGQHFLTSPAHAKRIAEAVPAQAQDNVLEIGPGRGALSVFLKDLFPRFHLVEIDLDVIFKLNQKLGEGKFTIHNQDALDFDYSIAGFPLHVVSNLPYSVGALIIKKTLLYGNRIKSVTFMVQREVAERIASEPHSKENGFLTIFCQFFGKPEILFNVPPGAFFPPPKVESSVFRIIIDDDLEKKLPENHWKPFFAFFSNAFTQRRKQLAKVLGGEVGSKEAFAEILEQIGVAPLSRPEDLDITNWLALYKRIKGV